MTQWTPNNTQDLNETDLPIAPRVRRALAQQGLTATDVLLVLTNSAWRRHGHKIEYRFDYLDDSPAAERRRAIGRAAGLERVRVVRDCANGRVTRVRRVRRRANPVFAPWVWTAAFRLTITPDSLRLTDHAERRMHERRLTREDVVLAIRHGRCEHRGGQVRYTLVARDARQAAHVGWSRLSGVVVVVCAHTTQIITVWRDHKKTSRRPRRGPSDWRGPNGPWSPSLQ